MNTKFGNAKLNKFGYYQIKSRKEGNNGKYLHRLIFEDYYNCKLDKTDVIHHIDGDKLNNHPANLICMSQKAHGLLHNKDRKFSEEHKQKISESKKGMMYSDKDKINMSKSKNTTGYYRVSKNKDYTCKQGFTWRYSYSEEGNQKSINSVDLEKLEQKVKAKGLKWKKLKGDE